MKYPVNNISQECKTALKSQFRIFYIGHSHGQSNIDSVTATHGNGKIFHIWYSFFLPFLIKQFWNLSHLICNLLENWSPCLYHQASANTWELMNIYSTKTKFVAHSKTPAQHLFSYASSSTLHPRQSVSRWHFFTNNNDMMKTDLKGKS